MRQRQVSLAFLVAMAMAILGSLAMVTAAHLKLTLASTRLPRGMDYMRAVYDGGDAIYLVGGEVASDAGSYQDDVIKYSLNSNSTRAEVVGKFIPMASGSAIMDGDHIYYIGGFHGNRSSAIYRITPPNGEANFSYEVVAELPTAISSIQAAFDPRRQVAYIFGGINSGPYLDTVLEFNVRSGEVREMPRRMPEGKYGIATAWDPHRESVHLFAGYNGPNTPAREILEYNPGSDRFLFKAALPYGMRIAEALYVDSTREVYIFDNYGLVKFRPETSGVQVIEIENLPDFYLRGAVVYVAKENRIYIFGGYGRYDGGEFRHMDEIFYIDLD